MEFIRGLHNLTAAQNGCVLTIGKFDGVHLGHQAVLNRVIEKAREMNLPAAVMVFEPQPEEVFTPDKAPARLSTIRDKITLLERQGIDQLISIRFNRTFAGLSPEAFIYDLLLSRLGTRFLVVGDDFRFGRQRSGDFSMLQHAGEREGFDVVNTESFRLHDCRISSTAIREALSESAFDTAASMLGRPFVIAGKVVHGEKKGRTIGFPTANIPLHRYRCPIGGVFACKVSVEGKEHKAVVNIGTRPTLNGERVQLEVHVFDFDDNLYGKRIHVLPIQKLRDEMRFDSFAELKQQINRDAFQAREALNGNTPLSISTESLTA